MSFEEAVAEQTRHANDPDGGGKWYTLGLRSGVRAMCNGASLEEAYSGLWGLNEKQLPKARALLGNFAKIQAANDDVDFAPHGPASRFKLSLAGQTVNVDHDIVGRLSDGRELWAYIHVADAALKEGQQRDLLHLAQYIADAQAKDAVVAIIDLQRARLIRVHDAYDPQHLRQIVTDAKRKLID